MHPALYRADYTKYVIYVIGDSAGPALARAVSSTDHYRPLLDPLRFIGVPSRYITLSMKYCPSESVRDSSM